MKSHKNTTRQILFLCASDTLVRLLVPVARLLQARGHQICLAKLQFTDERAELAIGQIAGDLTYVGTVQLKHAWLTQFEGVVMGNDWGREARGLIHLCNAMNIPSFCIQESVIDLEAPIGRMRHAAYALVQGAVSVQHLCDRPGVELVGNPRYEDLAIQPMGTQPKALVNCNFTYGIEEDNRHRWLRGVVEACDHHGLEVLILQHPRDKADLASLGKPVMRTSAATIHQALTEGTLLISRFSSVMHEAIALGRPAIYFDPFSEAGGYDFGPDGRALQKARSDAELQAAIAQLLLHPIQAHEFQAYLAQHIRPHAEPPSVRCADSIETLLARPWAPDPLALRRWRANGLLMYCLLERVYQLLRSPAG